MITLTPLAASTLKEMMAQEGQPDAALRVWVEGGGCSGYSYGLALDPGQPEEWDQVFESEGVRVFIDPMALNMMDGSTIDFLDQGLESGFKVENPKAVRGCGCGSSFTVEGEEAPAGGGCGSCASRA